MQSTVLDAATLRQFEQHLRAEEKAEATVKKYIRDAAAFAGFLGGATITKELAIVYKRQLLSRGYAIRSVNAAIASLNCLFVFLERHECRLKAIKQQRQIYCAEEKELTRAEYHRLLEAAQKRGNQRLDMLLQTLCGTGIRVSELSYITVEAVMLGKATVHCKSKTRVVFIPSSLQQRLRRYIRQNRLQSGAIFVSESGRPLDRRNIWRDMKALCESAGVEPSKVFPHNLRHLFARTFYALECDIVRLADLLGHSSVNTTRIYTMETGSRHRDCLERVQKKLMT